MLDLLELHMWMTHFSDFYKQVGYNYERFDPKGYDNLALKGEKLYRVGPGSLAGGADQRHRVLRRMVARRRTSR